VVGGGGGGESKRRGEVANKATTWLGRCHPSYSNGRGHGRVVSLVVYRPGKKQIRRKGAKEGVCSTGQGRIGRSTDTASTDNNVD